MLKYLILALFACAATVQLVGNWIRKRILCGITKPMLVSLLLLYYLAGVAPGPDAIFVCALAASWLGDVLLMFKGIGWFIAGGISFASAHVLLVITFARHATAVPAAVVVLLGLIYLAATGLVVFLIRNEAPKPLILPMGLYLLCNGVMNLFVLIWLLSAPGPGTALTYAGAVLFFVSDCVLIRVRFRRGDPWRIDQNFIIMTTYTLGMYLITQGVLLTG
ncbi:MAG: lysoplasmalogenase [Clostridia bacterium]|nr:lysoplasmalogenase [Clostridia bacterium]